MNTTEEKPAPFGPGSLRTLVLRLVYSCSAVLVPPSSFVPTLAASPIGREASGGIALPLDRRVSRLHATLHAGLLGTLHIIDEGSRNGTLVNGQPVKQALLRDGDVITIGDSYLVACAEPAAGESRPLRERRAQILMLLVEALGPTSGSAGPQLTPRLAEALLLYDWPGSDEELKAVAARLRDRAVAAEPLDLEHVESLLQRSHATISPALPPPAAAKSEPAHSSKKEIDRPFSSLNLICEGEVWCLSTGQEVLRLKDSKGLRFFEHLLNHPGQEFHVLQLSSLAAAEPDASAADEADYRAAGLRIGDGGDAGEVLDERSKLAYRRRIEALREAHEEAVRFSDRARASRIQEELDALSEQLAQAVGLGGRGRKAGAVAERARINVQRRLRDVLNRITELHPALGRYLTAAIRTGTYCCYDPTGPAPK